MLLTQLPRTLKIVVIVGVALTFLLVLHILGERPLQLAVFGNAEDAAKSSNAGPAGIALGDRENLFGTSSGGSELLPCQKLPGAEDILVVMRTGASEIKDKLPVGRLAATKRSISAC